MDALPIPLDSFISYPMKESRAFIVETRVVLRFAFWCLVVSLPAVRDAGTKEGFDP